MSINRRKFLLASTGGALLSYFGIAKEALAQAVKYKPDEYQGFNFEAGKQQTVGYITAMKVHDKTYPKVLEVTNPEDSAGPKLKVVGVITYISWKGGSKPIALIARITSRVLQIAGRQTNDTASREVLNDPSVEFEFVIYQYDDKKEKYYKSFHSGSNTLKGLVEKRGGYLDLDVNPSPSEVVSWPRNYELYISIVPHSEAQDLHVAVAHDTTTIEKWGPR